MIFADNLWYLASEDLFGAPQFDCPPQTPSLDPPLTVNKMYQSLRN